MSDLEIFAQSLIHCSSSDEQIVYEDKPDFLVWVNKNNNKAKEIVYGCAD